MSLTIIWRINYTPVHTQRPTLRGRHYLKCILQTYTASVVLNTTIQGSPLFPCAGYFVSFLKTVVWFEPVNLWKWSAQFDSNILQTHDSPASKRPRLLFLPSRITLRKLSKSLGVRLTLCLCFRGLCIRFTFGFRSLLVPWRCMPKRVVGFNGELGSELGKPKLDTSRYRPKNGSIANSRKVEYFTLPYRSITCNNKCSVQFKISIIGNVCCVYVHIC
jgi:hypothetical protein